MQLPPVQISMETGACEGNERRCVWTVRRERWTPQRGGGGGGGGDDGEFRCRAATHGLKYADIMVWQLRRI